MFILYFYTNINAKNNLKKNKYSIYIIYII